MLTNLVLLTAHCDSEIRNYGFGLSGRSAVPPQVDSDKLRNQLQAKHKCTVSQKLDTRLFIMHAIR